MKRAVPVRAVWPPNVKKALLATGLLATVGWGNASNSTGPVPVAIYDAHALAINNLKAFTLRSAIEIAQRGELNWPISCTDQVAVDRVSLTLRDFFHHSTDAVSVHLEHDGKTVLVVPTFGEPDMLSYGHVNTRPVLAEKKLRVGRDYTFSDGNFTSDTHDQPNARNLAVGANATQSSTYSTYTAGKAVDGDVYGLRSEFAITMTTADEQNRHNLGIADHEPWWQVDLGAQFSIGTIVLWTPENPPTVRAYEVQTITVLAGNESIGRNASAAVAAEHWFTLTFSYGSTTYETSAIDFGADACGVDGCESEDETGDSVQAKLEELPNIWHVDVNREDVLVEEVSGATEIHSDLLHIGYKYTVTFSVPTRGIPELEVGEFFDFGDDVANISEAVTIATQREADVVETPFAAATETERAYVMVSSTPFAENATLADAIGTSLWHAVVEYGTFREKKLIVSRDGVTPFEGRFVRIQLEEYHSLQFAEVEVFSAVAGLARNYQGGSPIASGEFISEESLSEAFRHGPAYGTWILRIEDTTDSSIYKSGTHRANEIGALNDWVLTVYDRNGGTHTYYAGVSTQVKTLPACGKIFKILEDGVTYEEITAAGNDQQLRDRCGIRIKEHVTASFNSVLATEQVLYVPNTDYSGRDGLTFATVIAGVSSKEDAAVDIAVKPCREQVCSRVVDTITCVNTEPDCYLYDESGFDAWTAAKDIDVFRVNSFDGHGEQYLDAIGESSAQEIASLGYASQAYDNLGSGYCTSGDNSLASLTTKIEMCYYTSGYESDLNCQSLCTNDASCQAYALGVWPGSREGTSGATLNFDDDDDDIESPWEQDAYIQAGTAGWCLAYTTSACKAGGVKANEGLPGKTFIDSDDVEHESRVDGSSGDALFDACMMKTDTFDYFCWSGSASGYCDDSLQLASYSSTLAECKESCVGIANNTGLSTTSGCTGIAFAQSGYCYNYDDTADATACTSWYTKQEATISGIDSYFIQPCSQTTQQV